MLEFSRGLNECLIVGDDTVIRVIEIQPAYVKLEIVRTSYPEGRRIETLWLDDRDDTTFSSIDEDDHDEMLRHPSFGSQTSLDQRESALNHRLLSDDDAGDDELDDGFLDFSDLVNWKPQEGRGEDDSRFDLETDLLPLR
jgi:hypothetical protein